jgi:hypothetical protein
MSQSYNTLTRCQTTLFPDDRFINPPNNGTSGAVPDGAIIEEKADMQK